MAPGMVTDSDTYSLTGSSPPEPRNLSEKPPPPADRGKDAYLFLLSCFILEAVVWGLPFTYGVFQDYYKTHDPFIDAPNLPVIGTTCLGILYLDLPLVFALIQANERHIRAACGLGIFLMALALVIASFANSVGTLIGTQGVLFGIGGSISYSTCLILISEWYQERKGLAFGIMLAGTGLGGTILPIVTEQLLISYGFRTTLRALAVALALLSGPFVYYMKHRVPNQSGDSLRSQINVNFMKTRSFAALQIANTIQGLGFFLPSIYLPEYARQITGASDRIASLTVIAYNIASVIGCVMMGSVVDKWHITTCCFLSTVGSTFSIFVIWGLSTSLAPLFVFAVVYGVFAGAWVATWPGMVKSIMRSDRTANASTVLAWVSTARGVGNVVSGPVSEILLRGAPWKGEAVLGYGSGYGVLIVFTGVTALLSSCCLFGRWRGWYK